MVREPEADIREGTSAYVRDFISESNLLAMPSPDKRRN